VDFQDIRSLAVAKTIFYTGPIDEYFGFCYGELPYRSLSFEHQHLPGLAQYQEVGTVNYPNDFEFTRITEFKHLTGQAHDGTSIVREYPQSRGNPYYPVLTAQNQELYQKYKALAAGESDVHFVGRLAEYKYYNMDQVVAAALKTANVYLQEHEELVAHA
jgi:UDP-galactopyranose mutase